LRTRRSNHAAELPPFIGRPRLPAPRRLVAVLALVIFAAACSPRGYTNLPPRAGQSWIAFGDSLTAGTGAEAGQDYPALLGRQLGIPIANLGRPGDTTADAQRRLDGVLSASDPRVVLLCLGGNDGLQRVPVADTVHHLGAIVDRCHGHGAFVVLIGIRSASLVDRYAKPFRRLARRKRVLYIPDLLAGVIGRPSLMADTIHPNEAGYRKIADRLAAELRPLLSQLATSGQGARSSSAHDWAAVRSHGAADRTRRTEPSEYRTLLPAGWFRSSIPSS